MQYFINNKKSYSRIILLILAVISVAWYLFQSSKLYKIGFPLDDAWIHQTYARNLAERGEWAFIPGRPSAGSTSPLWSGLLAIGYLLNINPLFWAFSLGLLSLWVLGYLGKAFISILNPKKEGWALLGGGLLIFEWHLIWKFAVDAQTLIIQN